MTHRRTSALAGPLLAGSILITAALAGCGFVGNPGTIVSEDRDVDDVTAVALRTSGNLTITTGEEPALTVSAGDNVIGDLTTEVRDGVLVLDERRNGFGDLGTIQYTLVLPVVDSITLDGSGDVDAELAESPELVITLNGSGDVTARGIEVDELTVELAGSGGVELSGMTGRAAVNVDGSGTYRGADLEAESASVTIAGSGDADVTATRTLDAVVEGSGSITFAGGATVTSRVDGSGGISER